MPLSACAELAAESRLTGLTLACSDADDFAALAFVSDSVLQQLEGRADRADDAQRLVALADGVPVISDAPGRALDVLLRAGARSPVVWDLLELASLLVPACPTGGLDRATTFFGIALDGSSLTHQARRALMLFQLLVATLDRVDSQTLLHAERLAGGLDWPMSALFTEALRQRTLSTLETGALATGTPIGAWVAQGASGRRRRRPPVAAAQSAPPIDAAEISRYLAPDARIAHTLEGYEPRAEQVRMAQLVAETLDMGGQLVLEAGTGTGKSLAYLLPTALWALGHDRRVVVSTATTTLQDQLFEQDLPLVQAALEGEHPLRATVLKGRTNYLCLRRWQMLLQAGDLTRADRMLLIKTLFWLPRTTTGDRAELRLSTAEVDSWQRLCAVTEACTPVRCAYHRIGVCYLARARRAAEDSHIVVANHALLLSDLASRSRVLPGFDALIVDEAHHLEDEATQQLGWRLGERELLNRLERLWSPRGGGSGAVPEALAVIATASGLRLPTQPQHMVAVGERATLQLGASIRRFFASLAQLLDSPDTMPAVGADDSTMRVTGAVRASSMWQELESIWAEAVDHQQAVEGSVAEISGELEGLPGPPDAARDLASELGGQLDYWRDVRRRLHGCVHQPGPGVVYWVAGAGPNRLQTVWLNAAPLDVASLLRERLFTSPEANILVSATMAIGGSFDYVKGRLGIEDAHAEALGSPFDYARAALLYVPNDVPEPTQSGYQVVVERTILDLVTRLKGRTLVLFTSRAQLRSTYEALREPLARRGITLLGQGIDESSRTRLLEAFRRGSHVTLLGTNAFWEGIDVVGDALSCVVVTRLPFAVPTDPVYTARAEQFEEPFSQYALPQAVLRLKQGFGRLIRSRSDRGAVVVLDRRLATRFYGHVFLRSLPPCSVKHGPAARAGIEVEGWLATPTTQLELQAARG